MKIRSDFSLLDFELRNLVNDGEITEEKHQEIMGKYITKKKTSLIQFISIVGALLLGIGVLTFVASNWSYINNPIKYGLVVTMVITLNLGGYKIKEKYPKTSKALVYSGQLAYGAGIFLIGQMFNYSIDNMNLMLLWFIGVAPLAYYTDDNITLILSQIILHTYTKGLFWNESNILPILIIVSISTFINIKRNKNKILTLINTYNIIMLILYHINILDIQPIIFALLIFTVSTIIYNVENKHIKEIHKTIANIIMHISGFSLTFSSMWIYEIEIIDNLEEIGWKVINLFPGCVIFTIIFLLYCLNNVKKENILSSIAIYAYIIKLYVDLTYDFLPKSLFFTIGGIILIAIGAYYERKRRVKINE